MIRRALAVAPLSLLFAAVAPVAAEGERPRLRTETVWIDEPAKALAADAIAADEISNIIYINRCVGGCQFEKAGVNDARSNKSQIPVPNGISTLSEFGGTDEAFDAVVECVRELYGPYDVEIVTEDPGAGVFHHEAVLAGLASELGIPDPRVGGIAPAACEPLNNVISFSFANIDPTDIETMCWTVAQESAHSFGMPNHVFECSDPMTYLGPDTGDVCGRKYFRNESFRCGEFTETPCRCGVNAQNSHVELMAVFGPGTPPAPSVVEILSPDPDSMVSDDFSVFFRASNPRQVHHADLVINGTLYGRVDGHSFAERDENYNFSTPDLPDGYLDIEVIAYDDIDTPGSTTITVLKGEPCSSADSCFAFQECNEGRCEYPAPTGQLGDVCEYEQFCAEGRCIEHGGEARCATSCNPNVADSCPDGFTCVGDGGCFPVSEGGCCSVAGGREERRLPLVALGLFVAGVVALRRRR